MIVIVMTYFNRRHQLVQTLESFKQYNPNDFGVVVVDDGSDDDIALSEYDFNIDVLKTQNKTWVQGDPAYNIGFKRALQYNPEIIIIQNAECLHYGNILASAKEVTDNMYVSFGCYSQREDGAISFNRRAAKFDGDDGWYNHSIYRPKGYHFCSAITAKNLINLNGFEERLSFGTGYDDDYFLHQVRCLGLEIKIMDDPFVIHQWHESKPYSVDKNKKIYDALVKNNEFRAEHLITEDL